MNGLMILGLCLLAPAIIISIGYSIYEIIKMVKEDIKLGVLLIVFIMVLLIVFVMVLLIVFVMAFVGSALLIISIG